LGEIAVNPDTAEPEYEVRIIDCGMNTLSKKYDLPASELDSVTDLK